MNRKTSLHIARKAWVFLLLMALTFLAISQRQLLSEALDKLAILTTLKLVIAFAVQLLLWSVQILVWRETVKSMSGSTIGYKSSTVHLAALVVGKYIPGKLWGMIARGGKLIQQGMTVNTAFEVTLYEQMLIVISAVLIFLIGYSVFAEQELRLFALCGFFACLSLPTLLPRFGTCLYRWKFFKNTPKTTSSRLAEISHARIYWLTWLHSIAWLLQGLIVIILAAGISINIQDIAWALIASNAMSSLIGFFAFFAPAGAGIREASFIFLLHEEISIENLAALTILIRLWTLVADLSLGIIGASLAVSLAETESKNNH